MDGLTTSTVVNPPKYKTSLLRKIFEWEENESNLPSSTTKALKRQTEELESTSVYDALNCATTHATANPALTEIPNL